MRGYPFFRHTIALLAGIFFAERSPQLIWWPVGIGLLSAVAYGFFIWKHERRPIRPLSLAQGLLLLLIFAALGSGLHYASNPTRHADHIGHAPQPPDAYEAVVTNLPEGRAKTYKVELQIRRGRIGGSYQAMSGRVMAYLAKGDSLKPTPLPHYGDVWLVLRPPLPADPPLNPAEFDYRRHLAHRGITHQQYILPWQRRVLGNDPPNPLTALAYRVNAWADSLFTRRIGTRAEYGIVNAMLLGVRDDLDQRQYDAYAAAGAVHILSVSGLHVGILFVIMTWFIRRVAPKQANRWWVVLLKISVLWFFALMTGFSSPILRSALMFTFLLTAGVANRSLSLLNTLAASAFLILCYDPNAAFSQGFQLSYLAVLGIGAWVPDVMQRYRNKNKLTTKLWELTVVALMAQLFTFPLAIYYFHTFPTYFLLANPVVMGLSTVLVPLALVTFTLGWIPYLGDGLGWLLRGVAWALNQSVEWLADWPGAVWDGLWLSEAGLVLLYLILGAVGMVALTRQRFFVHTTAVLALLLTALTVFEIAQQDRQRRLTVHFMPRKTAVSLTLGHQTTVLTDADWQTDPRQYNFNLKNTFGEWGVRRVAVGNLMTDTVAVLPTYWHNPDMSLVVWQGRSLLLINRLSNYRRWQLPALIDYVLVRRNALRSWDQLANRLVARQYIFDDSNEPVRTDSLLAQAGRRGIACHSIRQMGQFRAEW
ncbi:ComEC/Rec2 family competence protein [Fibrella aquatilis]|uniref:ComEC family competence protein n=1 Tax=Fibrella aquatilis TaxID=2817059 RepID=A0A939K222_9BACT|nr:ComEC/Rec2 family competence protein [Fibrella aquatilis]MBO0933656.1 ComEC family competence protein [Fibrella aquatilis]